MFLNHSVFQLLGELLHSTKLFKQKVLTLEERQIEAERRYKEKESRSQKFQKVNLTAESILEIIHSQSADLSMVLSILQAKTNSFESKNLSK